MVRPRLHSDEAILAAAQEMLLTLGPQGFSLSAVAGAVGMSRPALIQRFGNREALLLAMARREVDLTRDWLSAQPVRQGRAPAWDFLCLLVTGMGAGTEFPARVAMAALEATDPALRAAAADRYRLVQQAIAARLPAGEAPGLAGTLHAMIAGATMQWVVLQDGPLDRFVLLRLRDHLSALWPGEALALPG